LLPSKFHDDTSNGSRVTALTNKQTNPQTDIACTENNTTCAGVNTVTWLRTQASEVTKHQTSPPVAAAT